MPTASNAHPRNSPGSWDDSRFLNVTFPVLVDRPQDSSAPAVTGTVSPPTGRGRRGAAGEPRVARLAAGANAPTGDAHRMVKIRGQTSPTPNRRRLAAVGVAGVCAVGLLALTIALEAGAGVQQLDAALRGAVRAPGRGVGYLLLRALSLSGQRGVLWPGLLVLAVLLGRRGRTWRPVLLVAGALLAVAVTVLAIKAGAGRTAPRSGHDLLGAGGRSYPSGHAVNEVVGLGIAVALLTGPGRPLPLRRRPAVLVAVAVVAIGGVSLVVADFHWASDVLAGWLLGGALLAAGYALRRPASAHPPPAPTAGLRPDGRRPSGRMLRQPGTRWRGGRHLE